MQLLELVFSIFTVKKNSWLFEVDRNLRGNYNPTSLWVFSVFCLSLPSSFSLSWPTPTSCCPTWVPPTCPTTAATTCCLCSRTTERLHTRFSVLILFLCCGPALAVRCLLAPTICVCICLWVRVWVRVNVHECVVVYLWIVLLSFDIHPVQCAGIEGARCSFI